MTQNGALMNLYYLLDKLGVINDQDYRMVWDPELFNGAGGVVVTRLADDFEFK